MGNCQAAEAATVVIQHPGDKVERIYWAVSAHEIMNSNPGHYVALVITSPSAAPTAKPENDLPVKQLKLLRPDDTLHIGQVYRLISFEDVLKEFSAKKSAKLGKLLKQRGVIDLESKTMVGSNKMGQELLGLASSSNCSSGVARQRVGGQWRPTLQSIAEFET